MDSIIMEYGNYSVLSSLNERTIYMKITDNLGFLQYESNIDIKELRLNLDLADAYTIIKNCFQKKDGYNVVLTHVTGNLKLNFNALVGGFLKMNFELLMKERVMSNDSQLTSTINRLEQKISCLEKQVIQKNKEFLDLTEKLSYSTCCIWNGTIICDSSFRNSGLKPWLFPLMNIKELRIEDCRVVNLQLIKNLYCLEKICFANFTHNDIFSSGLYSDSLKEFCIYNSGNINSLKGIENLSGLTTINLNDCTNLTDVPTILGSYNCKIKHIGVNRCRIINVVEIQTFCQKNGIELTIS
jgi:hypothetical protein